MSHLVYDEQWESQPPLLTQADDASDITQGLVALFEPRFAHDVKLGLHASANTSVLRGGAAGIAGDFNGSINQQWLHNALYAQTGAITVLAFLDVDALTNYSAIIAKQGSSTTNMPYEMRLGRGPTESQIHVVRATGSDYRSFDTNGARLSAPATKQLVGFSFADGTVTTAPTIYVNGVAFAGIAVGGGGTGAVTDNGAAVWIGRRSDGATQLDGAIYWIAIWNRVLPDSEVQRLLANPWLLHEPDAQMAYWSTATGAYTLTADAGAFALSGQDATLLRSRVLVADAGVYTLSGQDATLTYSSATAYVLTADAGAFALSGQDATLLRTRILTAEAGAYALSGQDATLTYTPVGAYTLTAEAGAYALTGQDATFVYSGAQVEQLGGHFLEKPPVVKRRKPVRESIEDVLSPPVEAIAEQTLAVLAAPEQPTFEPPDLSSVSARLERAEAMLQEQEAVTRRKRALRILLLDV